MLFVKNNAHDAFSLWTPDVVVSQVTEVLITDESLPHYLAHFENMPYTSSESLFLYGDMAKVVAGNWDATFDEKVTPDEDDAG